MGCYNIAYCHLKIGQEIDMLRELAELEISITPDMAVYKNLVETGFELLLFKPGFLECVLILEEVIHVLLQGTDSFVNKKEAKEAKEAKSPILSKSCLIR